MILADQLNAQLQRAKAEGKPSGLPFEEMVFCNIGNPQHLKQKPLTFFREVRCVAVTWCLPYKRVHDSIHDSLISSDLDLVP